MTSSPARRLTWFIVGVLAFFALLEGVTRWNWRLFEAASHRALTKVAMFDLHPDVALLFLGTSRTQDGVSPALVTKSLQEIAPELGALPGFNTAFTGSSLEALTTLAPRFTERDSLQLAVIELSSPQLSNGPSIWDEPAAEHAGLEARLAEAASSLRIIKYRKTFVPENFGRLAKLMLFGASLGGWETKTSDQFASWRGRQEVSAVGFDAAEWTPELFLPTAPQMELTKSNEALCAVLTTLLQQFTARGVQVAFAVPPLSRKLKRATERDQLRPLFSEVARRGNCTVWNYAELPLPDKFFSNPSHLSSLGRAHYSAALALQVAQVLRNK